MVLVGYVSSDEDEEVQDQPASVSKSPKAPQEVLAETQQSIAIEKGKSVALPEPEQATIIGPLPQPEGANNTIFPPLADAPMEDEAPGIPPDSPYSSTRALLRDLTLPTVPNMDIPPSPPGSPPPGTNKKFEQFLHLKKKGAHFNSKIAQSSALKNPGLMDKLMGFVEISQKDQYKTTLRTDLWDPAGFPKYAYKEQLRKSQTEIGQARVRTKGAPIEFVAADGNSRDSTPGVVPTAISDDAPKTEAPVSNPGKRKTRFDM